MKIAYNRARWVGMLTHRLFALFRGSTTDLRPVRALLIGYLHVSIRSDANGIDLTLTYISISFTEFMRAGKSHERKFNLRAGVLMMADNKVRSARRRRYRAVSTQGMRVNLGSGARELLARKVC